MKRLLLAGCAFLMLTISTTAAREAPSLAVPSLRDTCAGCSVGSGRDQFSWPFYYPLAYFNDECSDTGQWANDGDCTQCPEDLGPDCDTGTEPGSGLFATPEAAMEAAADICGYGCHPMERGGTNLAARLETLDVHDAIEVAALLQEGTGFLEMNWERGALQAEGCHGRVAVHIPLPKETQVALHAMLTTR